MSIWYNTLKLDKINNFNKNTLVELLEIKVIDSSSNSMTATMPVGPKTHQPFGVLHGGASCVLAESVGSIASNMCIDQSKFYAAGLEINANHVRPISEGIVTAVASIIHLGSKTHIWNIEIKDDREKLICISRLTMVILPKK